MTYEDVVKEWNTHADEFNQWSELSEEEKVVFAFNLGAHLDDVDYV